MARTVAAAMAAPRADATAANATLASSGIPAPSFTAVDACSTPPHTQGDETTTLQQQCLRLQRNTEREKGSERHTCEPGDTQDFKSVEQAAAIVGIE